MADFEQLKAWVSKDWKAQREWREAAAEEYAFVDGHQWTDAERQDLETNARAPIVFNRVAPIIASVAGSEINNRTEVRFIPREIGDAEPNEVLTAGAEWFRDQSNAEDEESEAFRDALVAGLGWTETTLDFEEDPEGAPVTRHVELLEMFWDCHAHKKGLMDASRIGRARKVPLDEARELFPDAEERDLDADWLDTVDDEQEVERNLAGDEYNDENDGEENTKDTVTIVQLQWREKERFVEYVEPSTGQRDEMPKAKFDKVTQNIPLNIPSRTLTKSVWYQAFLGKEILKKNQPDPEGRTFHAITGHWDRKDKRFYGLMRSMRDPQRFANKWLSQTLHIINSNAKGGVMVESDAVEDAIEFEEGWAASDSVTWVKPGRMGSVVEKSGPQMPAALMALTEFAISSIRDVSGVNLEIMGLREANQPGILEYQRRQSAMTTLAGFFDSLKFYRKVQGITILHYLRNHIAPSGRLVRLVQEGQAQYVPLAMDEGTRKYDVIVDDAPSAPNEKEKAWSVIEAMMPMLQEAGLSLDDWADVLEYSPLPSSFVDKVRKKAEQQKQQPDPEQQMQEMAGQLEIKKMESEIAENQAETALDHVRAAQIQQQVQLAPIETAIKAAPRPGLTP